MQRVRLSVGFTDLTHYTKTTEVMEPEAAIMMLQERLEAAGDILVRHGCRIHKYMGDTILFYSEDVAPAVRAAREIAALPVAEVCGYPVGWRATVATGEVVAATIGHASHRVEDILGATVNRAAMLLREAAQSPDGVAFCPETQRHLGAT